jgi:hypothetical protein
MTSLTPLSFNLRWTLKILTNNRREHLILEVFHDYGYKMNSLKLYILTSLFLFVDPSLNVCFRHIFIYFFTFNTYQSY